MHSILCQLCRQKNAIKNGHVIPAFVYREIKLDSPTGFLRNPNNPNKRIQDGEKLPILCVDCELRFSKAESMFSKYIFSPYHRKDQDSFSYGPWFHYFMSSLAFRTLILDLPGIHANSSLPESSICKLDICVSTLRNYLLGNMRLGNLINNHAFPITIIEKCSPDLAFAGPHWAIRRGVGGYTFINQQTGDSAVMHNLAGFLCFLLVKGNRTDVWHKTKISHMGGRIEAPQRVKKSDFANDLINQFIKSKKELTIMSPRQKKKTQQAWLNNPNAASRRFSQFDKSLGN